MNVIEIEPGLLPVGEASPFAGAPAQPALLIGVRPEHIRFADAGLRAIVGNTEYFGADSVTTCRVGDQSLLVRTPGRPRLESGSAVQLSWPSSATHYFDKTSGLRREPPRNELRQMNA